MGRRSQGYIVTTYVASGQRRLNSRDKIDPNKVTRWARKFAGTLTQSKDLAYEAADDVVASVWERMAQGEIIIEAVNDLWPILSDEIYRKVRLLAVYGEQKTKGRAVSHDQLAIPGEKDSGTLGELGFTGRTKPNQIGYVYLREIEAQIIRLPQKERQILEYLAQGYNALDIAAKTKLAVHVVFHRIKDARRMMFHYGLWDGKDW